jgi:hypothetical protein
VFNRAKGTDLFLVQSARENRYVPFDPFPVTSGAPDIVIGRRSQNRYYDTLDLRVARTFLLPRGALDVFAELQ